jgi:hypothetical protein
MTSDDNARIVTFSGRVITRQDDLIITCDLMRVHYQPIGGPQGGQEAASAIDETASPGGTLAPDGQNLAANATSNASINAPGASNDPLASGQPATGPGTEPNQGDLNAPGAAPPLPPSVSREARPLTADPQAEGAPGPLRGGQEIYRIECEGSVKIQQRDRLAVGQKAL